MCVLTLWIKLVPLLEHMNTNKTVESQKAERTSGHGRRDPRKRFVGFYLLPSEIEGLDEIALRINGNRSDAIRFIANNPLFDAGRKGKEQGN